MRYTPTLKLSTRLVAFVTMIVISAMFILFLGGTLSFKRLGQEYLDHSLQGIVEVLDKEMEDPDAAYSLQRWMPKMLQSSNIVEMELHSQAGTVYRFKDTGSKVDKNRLYQARFDLERNPGYSITFKAIPPYIGYGYSMQALWSITLAVVLIVFCLMRGVRWLKSQLHGSELLEERGRMILAGRVEEYAKGSELEWPYTASEALDLLIEELQDARQERSRFDTFIRTQTFLDQLTGTANRVLFDSKLESALSESGSRGGVLLLKVDDWDQIEEEQGKKVANDFIVEVGEALSNSVARYPDVILSRYYQSEFAIFAPHLTSKDVSSIAIQCLKQLSHISPPAPLEKDNWSHIGMTMYQEGERQGRIMDEAETALKSAQLQKVNTWNRFEKQSLREDERGSVRWRTLFDQVLKPERLHIYQQSCYLLDKQQETLLDHYELFVRIEDPDKGIIKASRFSAAIETVGYEQALDRAVFVNVIKLLKESTDRLCYSVNLYVTPFSDREYFKWIRDELLQLTAAQRSYLVVEFPEARLVKHLDYMRPVVKMIAGLGCKVAVSQAGRSIVSTHYLKELPISFVKLHRSLIKQIHQRHENQLFIRSLLGACAGLNTSLVAVGVDSKQELNTLLELSIDGVQGRYFSPEQAIQSTQVVKLSSKKPVSAVQIGRRNRWKKSR
ncbi:RNase E specificity factor CsrD [Vibrio sonorensis]|uniref:RNase E specificity factor CsrD n=1 Tax=Vibrio sonorensis TaxID=1004316 RepID=UPI0008DA7375|nr:RNase E specificity factor CsrD [Vibrio sonorensis]